MKCSSILLLFLLFVFSNCFNEQVSYQSILGETANLRMMCGEKVCFLIEDEFETNSDLIKLIDVIDSAYAFTRSLTGFEPRKNARLSFTDKLCFAQVSNSCGVGCGYLGIKGVEIESLFFKQALETFSNSHEISPLFFYELGRNFFPHSEKLEIRLNAESSIISTAIAIFLQCNIISSLKIDASDINGQPYDSYYCNLVTIAEQLTDLDSGTFEEALRNGQNIESWSMSDIIASVLLKMQRESKKFSLEDFYLCCTKLESSITIQGALDNFALACSSAAGKNQVLFLKELGWPISDKVMKKLQNFSQTNS